MAMAAMIPMIATTMRSSINEKPSCRLFFMFTLMLLKKSCIEVFSTLTPTVASHNAEARFLDDNSNKIRAREESLMDRGLYVF